MDKKIIEVLRELNIPAGNKGFNYIHTAVDEVLKDEKVLDKVTGEDGLYGLIAKEHDTTASRAERAVRHGIECGFKATNADTWIKFFGNADKKAKNTDFIATIVHEVKYGRD